MTSEAADESTKSERSEGPYRTFNLGDGGKDALSVLRIMRHLMGEHAGGAYDWAFRGQADATWHLLPSALRVGTKLGYYRDRQQFVSRGEGGSLDQLNGELIAVRQFVELADRVGLSLPPVHPFFRQDGFDHSFFGTIAVGGKIGTALWPKSEMLELLAIAQHHGVPTRLLDFTFDPRIALYFAAKSAAELPDSTNRRMAIWAINLKSIYTRPRDFSVVEVERASNDFLRAQKGLFVLDKQLANTDEREAATPLDQRLGTLFAESMEVPVLIKVTCDSHRAQEALRMLEQEGVDHAHVMPSLDNVVAHLRTLS